MTSFKRVFYDLECYPENISGIQYNTVRLSVGVTCDDIAGIKVWYEADVFSLIEYLLSFEQIVGYNNKHFDNTLLGQYRADAKELLDLKSIDMLEVIEKRLGHRVSLQNIVEPTLKKGKIGDGELAVKLWLEGRHEELISYCVKDVELTKDLYEYGQEHKRIFYDSNGQIREVHLDWDKPDLKFEHTEFTYQILEEDNGGSIELDRDNKEFQLAFELVQKTNKSLYLTGRAGTGKTTFLKFIRKTVKKNSVVVAYTGVASINAGGQTIHSFFQINPNDPPFVPDDNRLRYNTPKGEEDITNIFNYFKYNSAKREILKNLELLIVDEVSMVRADFIDVIDRILRAFSGRGRDLPFGGVQVVFIGDAFQLPPIEGAEWAFLIGHYESPFFFSSEAFKKNQPIIIELKKIYRQDQRIESEFIGLLNRVRTNEPSNVDIARLNGKVREFDDKLIDQGFICLCSENGPANIINQNRLEKLKERLLEYSAFISGVFNRNSFPTEELLRLKIGSQVMFLKNGNGYYNGKIGKVIDLSEGGIIVSVKDSLGNERAIRVEHAVWENVKFEYNELTKKIDSYVIGKFIQYPLKLAWAITIHKSQGLTFEKVAVDVIYRGNFFRPSGLVYVALSRCKSWAGLVLNRELNRGSIHVDPRVVEFAKRTTPSTLIDDAINNGEANLHYKAARHYAKIGNFEMAYNETLNAIDFRNDLKEEGFKRYVKAFLTRGILYRSIIDALEKKNRELKTNELDLTIKLESLENDINLRTAEFGEKAFAFQKSMAELELEIRKLKSEKQKLEEWTRMQQVEICRLQKISWIQKLFGKK